MITTSKSNPFKAAMQTIGNGIEPARQMALALWVKRSAREQTGLKLAALLVAAGLVWQLGMNRALSSLRETERRLPQAQAELNHIQALEQHVQHWRKTPPIGRENAIQALQDATQRTLQGAAQLSVAGDQATVNIKLATAQQLTHWLTQTRVNARLKVAQAQLGQAAQSNSAANWATPAKPGLWQGTVVFQLPPQ